MSGSNLQDFDSKWFRFVDLWNQRLKDSDQGSVASGQLKSEGPASWPGLFGFAY